MPSESPHPPSGLPSESARTAVGRLRRLATGPLPRLPRPLDAIAEGWWRLPVRVRAVALVALACLVVTGLAVRSTTSTWGPGVTVVVATRNLAPGEAVTGANATWPADLVPHDALDHPPDGVATRSIRAGEVLTRTHLASDLDDLLEPGEVAVALDRPVPTLPSGARLDLLGTDFEGRGRRLGSGRLLAVDGEWTWVAVDRSVAPDVAAALSTGQVSLALATGE